MLSNKSQVNHGPQYVRWKDYLVPFYSQEVIDFYVGSLLEVTSSESEKHLVSVFASDWRSLKRAEHKPVKMMSSHS